MKFTSLGITISECYRQYGYDTTFLDDRLDAVLTDAIAILDTVTDEEDMEFRLGEELDILEELRSVIGYILDNHGMDMITAEGDGALIYIVDVEKYEED